MASTGAAQLNEQVAQALREDIAKGRLKPDEQVPSIRALAARFGFAPGTIRNALASLADEGLIRPNSTRGYFVSVDATSKALAAPTLDGLARQVAELAGRVAALEAERGPHEAHHQ
jgi:DNA-binding GntR family transcriptional regulator